MAALATAHSASARSSAEGASASPITVPPPPPAGYDYRAKYCLPDPADDNFPDLVREMIEQDGAEPPGPTPAEYTDAWCRALTRQDLLQMYAGLYGAGALGLLPTAGLRRADRLVVQLGTRARVLHRRDPTLLGPLVDQVEKICDDVLEEGAPATFSELVCLLEALDYRSRGDSGWANVQDRTDGGIVSEFSGVMMAAAACVLICMFNMGAVGAHGSAQRTAFATALAMRENLSSDGEESELYTDMATRLDALEAAVEAGEHGPGYGKAGLEQYEAVQEAKLKCGLDELVSAYNGFVETYAEDVADYPSDDD